MTTNKLETVLKEDALFRQRIFTDEKGRRWLVGDEKLVITKEEFLMCYREWVEKPQMRRNATRVKR